MSLPTLYSFLSHDVLANVLAALAVTGLGYTAKKLRTHLRKRNADTDHTTP
ncbi:hypothetical protein [Streptomyces sp. NBC_00162]|uniref:hypothetical protein n=1 Tax=Streptomyces sp. NBC_00162 TaxID=2903629 RepID=UPI00214C6DB7|nr:hypothetical protein [Streptomyces sp. NBC_00162]UUU37456.1 hypothetical protein JIW86_00010 [Streptomyces sp. NBC_00162]